jgi:hypothetical protein
LALIGDATERLDKALNGNGRPGLIEDHRVLQRLVEEHLETAKIDASARLLLATEAKEAKDLLAKEAKDSKDVLAEDVKTQREKISNRTWAIIFGVIMLILTNAASLAVIFIRTGGIR